MALFYDLVPGSSDGVGTFASFNNPVAMAIDQDRQHLYISDYNNNLVRKVDINSNETTTVAYNISGPMGIAVDVLANPPCVYVTSFTSHAIYKISMTSGGGPPVWSVFAGSLGNAGYVDGNLLGARFMNPLGLALDYFHGVMIVGDSFYSQTSRVSNGMRIYTTNYQYSLRKISMSLGDVTTLAGKSGKLYESSCY